MWLVDGRNGAICTLVEVGTIHHNTAPKGSGGYVDLSGCLNIDFFTLFGWADGLAFDIDG